MSENTLETILNEEMEKIEGGKDDIVCKCDSGAGSIVSPENPKQN